MPALRRLVSESAANPNVGDYDRRTALHLAASAPLAAMKAAAPLPSLQPRATGDPQLARSVVPAAPVASRRTEAAQVQPRASDGPEAAHAGIGAPARPSKHVEAAPPMAAPVGPASALPRQQAATSANDVRALVGPDVPLAVSMDLHANLTVRKTDGNTLIFAYRTNPHRDHARVGQRVGEMLLRTAVGEVRPVSAWRTLPMLLGGGNNVDFLNPMRPLYRWMRRMERDPRVLYISLFQSQPWLDHPEVGWATHVVTDDDPELAERLASLGVAEDVANAALFLASDEATFITGENLMVDGGWMAN